MLRMRDATRRRVQGDDTAALRALEGARTDVWFQHAVASPTDARSCCQEAREQPSAPDEVYAPVVSELESRIAILA
jgi:hypothetical protein